MMVVPVWVEAPKREELGAGVWGAPKSPPVAAGAAACPKSPLVPGAAPELPNRPPPVPVPQESLALHMSSQGNRGVFLPAVFPNKPPPPLVVDWPNSPPPAK